MPDLNRQRQPDHVRRHHGARVARLPLPTGGHTGGRAVPLTLGTVGAASLPRRSSTAAPDASRPEAAPSAPARAPHQHGESPCLRGPKLPVANRSQWSLRRREAGSEATVKRTVGPQDNEPGSKGCCRGEPAGRWRSLKPNADGGEMPSASVPAGKRSMRDPRATRVAPGRAAGVDAADVGGPGNGVHATPAGVPCAGPESITRNAAPAGEPIPMRKQPTGEPCAGELHARFGGRGGASLPYPYQLDRRAPPVQSRLQGACRRRGRSLWCRAAMRSHRDSVLPSIMLKVATSACLQVPSHMTSLTNFARVSREQVIQNDELNRISGRCPRRHSRHPA